MPEITAKTKWTFVVDSETGLSKLRIEYHSDLPVGQHEEIHRQIVEKAKEVIAGLDLRETGRCRVLEIVDASRGTSIWINESNEQTVREENRADDY